MHCPYCHHGESKVTDSRGLQEQNAIRRRRECLKCLKRFTTFETVDLVLQVKKRDGTYEDFRQDKLIKGLQAAARHTRVSHADVQKLATQVTSELMQKHTKEVTTTELGELVMRHLQDLDPVAYIRFACVYRRFKSVDEVAHALQDVSPREETLEKVVK